MSPTAHKSCQPLHLARMPCKFDPIKQREPLGSVLRCCIRSDGFATVTECEPVFQSVQDDCPLRPPRFQRPSVGFRCGSSDGMTTCCRHAMLVTARIWPDADSCPRTPPDPTPSRSAALQFHGSPVPLATSSRFSCPSHPPPGFRAPRPAARTHPAPPPSADGTRPRPRRPSPGRPSGASGPGPRGSPTAGRRGVP